MVGNQAATSFPLLYVDADVELGLVTSELFIEHCNVLESLLLPHNGSLRWKVGRAWCAGTTTFGYGYLKCATDYSAGALSV